MNTTPTEQEIDQARRLQDAGLLKDCYQSVTTAKKQVCDSGLHGVGLSGCGNCKYVDSYEIEETEHFDRHGKLFGPKPTFEEVWVGLVSIGMKPTDIYVAIAKEHHTNKNVTSPTTAAIEALLTLKGE